MNVVLHYFELYIFRYIIFLLIFPKLCSGLTNSGVTESTLTFSPKVDTQGSHQYLHSCPVTLLLHVATYNQNLKG